jgi:hypothetical protein
MPSKLPPLDYAGDFEVRYVSFNAGTRWKRDWVNVSIVCAGEYVGLEEIDNGIWNVYFGSLKLGRLLEDHMRIEDANAQAQKSKTPSRLRASGAAAEKCADSIVDAYRRPPVTFEHVYKGFRESHVDPLAEFTKACREELKSMLKSL